MKSKTIILSMENEKGRGILTLFQDEDLLQCRIRLYNMEKLSRYCKLGIYHNQEVFSANLLEKGGVYTSSMVGNFEIDKDFYAAIINTENENKVILSGGTYAGFFFNEQATFENELNSKNFTPANISENLSIKTEQNQHLFDEIEKEDPTTNLYTYSHIKEIEEKCGESEKCKTCKYKEFFYAQKSVDNFSHEELCNNKENDLNSRENIVAITDTLNKVEISQNNNSAIFSGVETSQNQETEGNQKTILKSLIPQFKYVFENYPQDELLNNLIPNSKFVKIEENESSYSIGAIYNEEEMKYICYAVLCNYNTPAPEELGEHYQWLPLDKEDPLSEGYYIVFQDAVDLKIVNL